MQRKQLLIQIDRRSKKWQKEISHSGEPYRLGFWEGVNKVKELINEALPPNNKQRRKRSSSPKGDNQFYHNRGNNREIERVTRV